jgi:septal ring factor EnvC (AmiA/AmiB activator)
VRIAEHALSEFKKDRERTERAFYESAKSERDALQTEVERLKGEVTGTSERNKELHFYSAQLSSDLADARRRLDGLQDTSRTIRLMFDDGTFTRNTSGDHEKGWALRAIKITKAIGDWCDAMDATEPEAGEGEG